jgi:2-methylcitrate dehydratase PrpD
MTKESPTAALAAFVTGSAWDAIPADVRDEAKRAILNYLGCALGGSVEPALDTVYDTGYHRRLVEIAPCSKRPITPPTPT